MQGAVKTGTLQVTWKDGGKAFEYVRDGKTWRFDIASKKTTEVAAAAAPAEPGGHARRPGRRADRPAAGSSPRPCRPTRSSRPSTATATSG